MFMDILRQIYLENIKLAKNDDEYLVAKTILDRDNSIGVDVLQALDKIENKLGEEGGNTGTQNFRYINIEDRILQGCCRLRL